MSAPTTEMIALDAGGVVCDRIREAIEQLVERKISSKVSAEIDLSTGHATVYVTFQKEEQSG